MEEMIVEVEEGGEMMVGITEGEVVEGMEITEVEEDMVIIEVVVEEMIVVALDMILVEVVVVVVEGDTIPVPPTTEGLTPVSTIEVQVHPVPLHKAQHGILLLPINNILLALPLLLLRLSRAYRAKGRGRVDGGMKRLLLGECRLLLLVGLLGRIWKVMLVSRLAAPLLASFSSLLLA